MGTDADSEVIKLIKDLQKQVMYLERKIDSLIKPSSSRSSDRPSRGRSFSQGTPSFGKSSRYKDKHESKYGARSDRPSRSFDTKPRDDDKRGAKKTKAFGKFEGKKPGRPKKKPSGNFKGRK